MLFNPLSDPYVKATFKSRTRHFHVQTTTVKKVRERHVGEIQTDDFSVVVTGMVTANRVK